MLAMFANLLTDRYMSRQVEDKLNAKLSAAEVEYLGHLSEGDGPSSDEVTCAEYTALQLLRLGMVDRGTLRKIKENYKRLEAQGSGKLRKSDFVHAHHLEKVAGGDAARRHSSMDSTTAPGQASTEQAEPPAGVI